MRALNGFSLYQKALEACNSATTQELGCVQSISRRYFDEIATFKFRAQAPCLEYIALLINTALLLRTNRAGRIYAGFQKLSSMQSVSELYLRIADISERVYIFGETDWLPPRHPNMRIINLDRNSTMSRESFIIAHSPTFKAALVAIEEKDEEPGSSERERHWFKALKSTHPEIVARLSDDAEMLVDAWLVAA